MAKYALLRLRHSQPEPEPVTEVNIIPVIDISLVLLVILFVTAPLLSYPNLPIKLPRGGQPEPDDQGLAVTCTLDEKLAVRSADSSWDSLEADLRGELVKKPEAAVVLRVDAGVPYRTVQRIMASAKAAGARNIALAADPQRK